MSLSKMAPSLKKVMIGLGWDTNKYDGGYDFDLDASAFLCESFKDFIGHARLVSMNVTTQINRADDVFA